MSWSKPMFPYLLQVPLYYSHRVAPSMFRGLEWDNSCFKAGHNPDSSAVNGEVKWSLETVLVRCFPSYSLTETIYSLFRWKWICLNMLYLTLWPWGWRFCVRLLGHINKMPVTGLNNRNLLSHSSGGQKSTFKALPVFFFFKAELYWIHANPMTLF